MTGFPWNDEIMSKRGIRSTSRTIHNYDFEDIDYDGDDTYRVLDIGCGGAAYMEEIADQLYNRGVEEFEIIGVDINEEVLRRTEMNDLQLAADGLQRTADQVQDEIEGGDYLKAVYDAARGIHSSLKTPMQRETELPEETELVTGDAENLPFKKDSFDLVTSQFLTQYDDIVDPIQIRAEAERVAKPEGETWFYGD